MEKEDLIKKADGCEITFTQTQTEEDVNLSEDELEKVSGGGAVGQPRKYILEPEY
jgi:hypothetical protein